MKNSREKKRHRAFKAKMRMRKCRAVKKTKRRVQLISNDESMSTMDIDDFSIEKVHDKSNKSDNNSETDSNERLYGDVCDELEPSCSPLPLQCTEVMKVYPNNLSVNEFDILMEKIISIEEECKQTSSRVEQIFQMLHSKQSLLSAEVALPEKYGVTLPLETPLDLMNFEKKLRENENCRNDMTVSMKMLVDKEKLTKSALYILKKFLSRNTATQYIATKKMENKYVMKMNIPTFLNCLKKVLSSTHRKTEAEVISAIGTILTNSKDWDQHRTKRIKNNTSHHEEDIANQEVV